mmetsp:Transcript_3847/g.14295  ORF Transcript_3847/g.14295 Transcript_3847/m.14295 type:complete len:226 (+) Transcript_3847:183-860(+)
MARQSSLHSKRAALVFKRLCHKRPTVRAIHAPPTPRSPPKEKNAAQSGAHLAGRQNERDNAVHDLLALLLVPGQRHMPLLVDKHFRASQQLHNMCGSSVFALGIQLKTLFQRRLEHRLHTSTIPLLLTADHQDGHRQRPAREELRHLLHEAGCIGAEQHSAADGQAEATSGLRREHQRKIGALGEAKESIKGCQLFETLLQPDQGALGVVVDSPALAVQSDLVIH